MKRLFSIFLSLLALPAILMAQGGSMLQFDKTVHDFGQVLISEGAVSCVFTGTNVSKQDISIMSVNTSCGCTKVNWTHGIIKPGEKLKISATYTNDEGPYSFDKTLTVKVAGQAKPIILHMRGISQEKIRPDSEIYSFRFGPVGLMSDSFKCGNLEMGSSRNEEQTIANLSDKPVRLSFEDLSSGLSLEVKPNPIPASGKATLFITVKAEENKWGYNEYFATPVTNGTKSNEKIKIVAFTAENFTSLTREQKQLGSRPVFAESTFSFGHKKQGARITATFTCTNKGKQELVVHKADSDFPGAIPSTFPVLKPGQEGKFTVSLDTSALPKGEALVMITLTTNSPLRPIVTLFLAGIID